MHILKIAIPVAVLGSLAMLPGHAQQAPAAPVTQMPAPVMPMPGMPMPPGADAATSAGLDAEKPMMAAMETMSQRMGAVPMTGDADRDFVAMMIPHHEGAIDMARFELANGHDPAMRTLAQAIVSAQESEIREMRDWQTAHPGPP